MNKARKIIEQETEKAQQEPPERITVPACKIFGKVYTGAIHGLAVVEFMNDPSVSPDLKSKFLTSATDQELDGFLTTKGRFVNRRESYEIAHANDQLAPEWRDPKKAADFNNTDKPELDSGWVKEWAKPDLNAMIGLWETAQASDPQQKAYLLSIVENLRKIL